MTTIAAIWFTFAWFLLTLLEVSTPQFIIEYDTRPNRLYVDYLKHPQEVVGMLWKGYKLMIGIALIGLGLIVYSGWSIFGHVSADPRDELVAASYLDADCCGPVHPGNSGHLGPPPHQSFFGRLEQRQHAQYAALELAV